MKSVLVQISRDGGQEARLQAALDVVRAFGGHLSCLQSTPIEAFAALDPYGVGAALSETVMFVRELEQTERQTIETRLGNEGVSWDWIAETGDAARMIGEYSWLTDLVVVSSPDSDQEPHFDVATGAADVVLRTRAAVLAVPPGSRGFDCDGAAAIAWNGSAESCAAIRAALPLLKRAGAVYLINVVADDGHDLPPTDAATWLSRHGVACEMVEVKPGAAPITEVLLEAAETRKAGYLVSGAFGHSRLRETILGGVSRGLLQKAKLPLLLAH